MRAKIQKIQQSNQMKIMNQKVKFNKKRGEIKLKAVEIISKREEKIMVIRIKDKKNCMKEGDHKKDEP